MFSRRRKFIIYLTILLVMIGLSVGFSALQKQLSVHDMGAEVRLQKDVRVSNISVSKASGNAVSNFEDYNKEKLFGSVSLPSTNSYVLYKVDLTNYGNVKSGLLSITNNESGTSYSICDSDGNNCTTDPETKICNGNNCTLGTTKEIYVKVSSSTTGTKNVNLDLDFEPYNDITYEYFNENTSSFKSEIMSKDSFSVTFTSKPEEVEVTGEATHSYNKNTGLLEVSNVSSALNIRAKYKVNEVAETSYSGSNPDNFVKFNNTLYRIVTKESVDDGYSNTELRTKIVKESSIGNNPFDNSSNEFGESSLKDVLNDDYYDTLDADTKDLLDTTLWTEEYAGYIGLINSGDYTSNSNWLTMEEFTVTKGEDNKVVIVTSSGLSSSNPNVNKGTYPCVYLKSDVLVVDGDGSRNNPYILELSGNGLQTNPTIIQGRTLTVTGSNQELVTVTNKVGTVYYSTSTRLTSENYTSGSTSIPTARNTGTYTIYYYIPAGENYKPKSGSVKTKINGLTYTIAYVQGENISSIGKDSDSCTTSGSALTCSVTLPSITPAQGYENGVWKNGSNTYNVGSSFTLNSNNTGLTLTSEVSGKTYVATFYYYNGTGFSTETRSCTVSSGSTCNVTVPSEVQNSGGAYGGSYKGISDATNSMTLTNTTLSESKSLYAVYQTNVTNYYYNSTAYGDRTLYRNEYFSSSSALSVKLSTSETGVLNYDTATGPGSSVWTGLSTAQDTNAEYNSVDAAAASTSTTLYTVYTFNVSYEVGTNVREIGATGDTCKVTTSSTSCNVVLPSITPNNGYDSVGWSTTNGSTTGTQSGQNYTLDTNGITLYANAVGSTYTATFYYYNGTSVATKTSHCTVSSGSSCNVTIPSEVSSSSGVYGSVYKGVASSASTMNEGTLTINNNTTKFYAIYSSPVTRYYYSSGYKSNTIYRNEYFINETTMNSVLTTVDNGTTNYTSSRGPGSSNWIGLSTAQDTTPEYNTVALAAKSTATTLYTVYEFNITYEKSATVSAIGANSDSCRVTTSDTSCAVMLPSITPNAGYTTVGWSTTNGDTSGTPALSVYLLDTNNRVLYANAIAANYQNMTTNESYMTLNEAFAAVSNNQTIKVLQNVTETTTATLASGKAGVKLDLNGKTITSNASSTAINNSGDLTIYNSSLTDGKIEGSSTNLLYNMNTLSISQSTDTNKTIINNTNSSNTSIYNYSGYTVNINNKAEITSNYYGIDNRGTLNVYNGSVSGNRRALVNNGYGTANISGGTFTGNSEVIENSFNAHLNISGTAQITASNSHGAVLNSGVLAVSGGTITGGYGIGDSSTSTTTISGGTITGTSSYAVAVYKNTTITGGTITGNSSTGGISIGSGATATISGSSTQISSSSGNGINNSGTLNISQGTVSGSFGIDNMSGGQANISGTVQISGTITGIRNTGTATISGGTITGTNNGFATSSASGSTTDYGTATITGGTITGGENGIYNIANGTITLGSDDSNVGTTSPIIQSTNTSNSNGINNNGTFNFYDGIIKSSSGTGHAIDGTVTNIPTGYTIKKTTTNGIESAILVADNYQNTTTNVKYITLNEAFANVSNNQTIKVLNNVTETTVASLASNKTGIKLDLNGKTITMSSTYISNSGTLDIYNSSSTDGTINGGAAQIILNYGTLTLNGTSSTNKVIIDKTTNNNANCINNTTSKSLTINNNVEIKVSAGTSYYGIQNSGTATINGGTITGSETGIYNTGTAIVTGGNISGDSNGIDNLGTATITGGTITGVVYSGIFNQTGSDLEISGSSTQVIGTGTSSNGIDNLGTATISGGTITGREIGINNSVSCQLEISGSNTQIIGTSISGIENSGTATINGGTITGSVMGIHNYETATATISGGTISTTSSNANNAAIYNTGTINMSDGTITTDDTSALVNMGNITITGGTLTGVYGIRNTGTNSYETCNGIEYSNMCLGTATITGGTVTGSIRGIVISPDSSVTVGTNDSTVSTTIPLIQNTESNNNYYAIFNDSGTFNFYDGIIKSSSGTGHSIDGTVTNIPTGYTIKKTTTNGIESAILVADNYQNTTTNVKYETLNEAFSDVSNNQTIKVLNNTTESVTATLASGKTGIKLDLNGKTITSNATSAITNNGVLDIYNSSSTDGTITGSTTNLIVNNRTLTTNATSSTNKVKLISSALEAIYNDTTGTVTINNNTVLSGRYSIVNDGTMTIQGGTINSEIDNFGTMTINNGTISTTELSIANKTGSQLTINGGTISSSGTASNNNTIINSGTMTVLGGTITGSGKSAISAGGTTIIGTNDSTVNTTSPVIESTGTSDSYGVNGSKLYFYDGVIKSASGTGKAIYSGVTVNTPTGYTLQKTTTNGIESAILVKPLYATIYYHGSETQVISTTAECYLNGGSFCTITAPSEVLESTGIYGGEYSGLANELGSMIPSPTMISDNNSVFYAIYSKEVTISQFDSNNMTNKTVYRNEFLVQADDYYVNGSLKTAVVLSDTQFGTSNYTPGTGPDNAPFSRLYTEENDEITYENIFFDSIEEAAETRYTSFFESYIFNADFVMGSHVSQVGYPRATCEVVSYYNQTCSVTLPYFNTESGYIPEYWTSANVSGEPNMEVYLQNANTTFTTVVSLANYLNTSTNSYHKTLSDAFNSAYEDNTIKVLNSTQDDANVDSFTNNNTGIKLDLNGKNLRLNNSNLYNNGSLDIYNSSSTSAYLYATIENNGTLTFNGTSSNNIIYISNDVLSNNDVFANFGTAIANNNTRFTGVINNNGSLTTNGSGVQINNSLNNFDTLIFNSGTVYGGIINNTYSEITINNGSFFGGIENNGDLTQNNGYIYGLTNYGRAILLGGSVTGSGRNAIDNYGELTLGANDSGVNSYSPSITAYGESYGIYNNGETFNFYDGVVSSENGTGYAISSDPDNIPTGYIVFKDLETDEESGIVTEKAYLVQPNYQNMSTGKIYTYLYEAFDDLSFFEQNNVTIKVLQNVTEPNTAELSQLQGIKLDLNGKTITYGAEYLTNDGELDIYNSSSTTGYFNGEISNYGKLTINGTSSANNTIIQKNVYNGDNSSIFVLNSNGQIGGLSNYGTATISGGNINSTPYEYNYYSINNVEGTVTINSGSINGPYGIKNETNATLIINGGTITATTYEGLLNSGTVNITGGSLTGKTVGIENDTLKTITISGASTQIISTNGNGINNYGSITMSNGTIQGATNGVYNNYVYSSGTSYYSDFTITGGTITGSENGFYNFVKSTLTIGTNDGNVSTTTPTIKATGTSNNYGLYMYSESILNFYDGVIKSSSGTGYAIYAGSSIVVNNADERVISYNTSNGIESATLVLANYTNTTTHKGYSSLSDAWNDVESNQTVRVLKNVDEANPYALGRTKQGVFLDLNGKTLNLTVSPLNTNGGLIIINTSSTDAVIDGVGFSVLNENSSLTINSQIISNKIIINSDRPFSSNDITSTIVINDNTIFNAESFVTHDGTFTINGGVINSASDCGIKNYTNLTINNGTITGATYGICNYWYSSGSSNYFYGNVTLLSGTITGATGGISGKDGTTLTLGSNDSTVSVSSPIIQTTGTSNNYGINMESGATFNFYDGIIKSASGTGYSIIGSITDKPSGYNVYKETVNGVENAHLLQSGSLMAGTNGSATTNYLRTNIKKQDIESLTFANSLSGHTANGTDCFDVSLDEDGSVLAWVTDSNSNGKYEMTIGANGKVYASSGAYLFQYLSSVTSIQGMQYLDTSYVTNMTEMFREVSATSIDLNYIDTSNVTNMYGMFQGSKFTTINLSKFDTTNVTDMRYMFYSTKVQTLDLTSFNTPNLTNMSNMFAYSTIEEIDLTHLDTSNVTTMSSLFAYCQHLTTVNMSNMSNDELLSIAYMFMYCRELVSLNLTNFTTPKVTNMKQTFYECEKLASLNVTSFDTSHVTDMLSMFSYCTSLTELDLSNFDTSSVTEMTYMFRYDSKLETIYASESFVAPNVNYSGNMFSGCSKLVGGQGTATSSSSVFDGTYAHIDGGTSNPGYFTEKVNISIPSFDVTFHKTGVTDHISGTYQRLNGSQIPFNSYDSSYECEATNGSSSICTFYTGQGMLTLSTVLTIVALPDNSGGGTGNETMEVDTYQFNGWYTAITGGIQILNANGTLNNNVTGYLSSGAWNVVANYILSGGLDLYPHFVSSSPGGGEVSSIGGDLLYGSSSIKKLLESTNKDITGK